jgi:hypothetical protein
MVVFREARFVVCTLAVILIYKSHGAGWLMNGVAVNAFLNLFSGQHLCVTGSCRLPESGKKRTFLPFKLQIPSDPVEIFHAATTIIGGLFLLYGIFMVWG